jgi:hypothetical protein
MEGHPLSAGACLLVAMLCGGPAFASSEHATGVTEFEDAAPSAWRAPGRFVLRTAPSHAAPIAVALLPGEQIQVFGRVTGTQWFGVQRKGRLLFFRVAAGGPAVLPGAEASASVCPVRFPPQE